MRAARRAGRGELIPEASAMLVIEDAWQHRDYPRPTVATVGNFDGLHRGQQAILERVRERASKRGAVATVVTFEPHPLSVLRSERPLQRITSLDQKRTLMRRLGIEVLAEVRFSWRFAETSAESFVEELLHRKLGVEELYVGSRFTFGHRRAGNLDLLERLGVRLGFRVHGVDEITEDGETISSTRVRQAIRAGEVDLAARLLGRCFAITGEVVHGEGRGKDQGWPTINLAPDHDLLPADGVYAARVWLPEQRRGLAAVTNIGRRPTFPDGNERIVEAHLFDFGRDIYGSKVELAFAHRLRGERRFESVAALIRQIGTDAELAREYLASEVCSTFVPTIGD